MDFKLTVIILGISQLVKSTIPPSDCSYTAPRHLQCQLTSINSRLEKTDFSVVPNNTLSLSIYCSQSTVGQLEPYGFSGLTQLQSLVLENCVLNSLPTNAFRGLQSLKSLSVRKSRPSGLSAADKQLDIQHGAFIDLDNLELLDLSENLLESLPSKSICGLQKLKMLNVSSNQFGSLADLGVPAPGGELPACMSQLDTLDMSNNDITSIDNKSVLSYPTLATINLANNHIRYVADNVFSSSAKIINLSNNQINHLPANLIQTAAVRELNLANNTLSAFPSSFFVGQYDLEKLSLAGNMLTTASLSTNLTIDLLNLIELDLCHNQVQTVPEQFLASMLNLQILKLCGNKLSSVHFPELMPNLVNLDLSSNQLRSIEPGYFSSLPLLTQLSLSDNQINVLHPAAFNNNTDILILDLSRNQMYKIPDALSSLNKLQTLDLGWNQISSLHSLDNMEQLWRLQIPNNLIAEIPAEFFTKLVSLQVLDLSNNRLAKLEPGSLDLNPSLRAVRLDGNYLTKIDSIFTKLSQLVWLNVSNNQLNDFDYTQIPHTLHWLDVSHNQINQLGNYLSIENSSLSYLDASFNKIQQISSLNIPQNLETILLNDNKISEISQYAFFDKVRLVKVDLSVNELTSFSKPTLLLSPTNIRETVFHLGGNPIVCDCDMAWFQNINTRDTLEKLPFISDIESIYCKLVNAGDNQAFVPLVEAREDQFLCQYETHCFSLCQCCQFDSCDCEMTCPDGCSCFHDNSWTKNMIQCTASTLKKIPENIPMDSTEILLDGNDISVLKSHTFIGKRNLKSLHLNNSRIDEIEQHAFNGLVSLEVLHLENNNLRELHGFEFSALPNLKELYLHNNQLSSIHPATFKALKNLKVLTLGDNSIVHFPVWELAANQYLSNLELQDNEWSCDCEFRHSFYSWLQSDGRHKVVNADNLHCVPATTTNKVEKEEMITSLTVIPSSPCASLPIPEVARNQQQDHILSEAYMPLLIGAIASVSIMVLLILLLVNFRHSIRMWMKGSKSTSGDRMMSPSPSQGSSNAEDSCGGSKLFDAYISYSVRDSLVVSQLLASQMEPYTRVCLHHRDLPTHSAHLADSVTRVADASKKIIIILSQNYLETEWTRLDYKTGLLRSVSTAASAINGGIGGGGASKHILFLVVGPINLNMLDPTLRVLMNTGEVLSITDPSILNQMAISSGSSNSYQLGLPAPPIYSTMSETMSMQRELPSLPHHHSSTLHHHHTQDKRMISHI